MLLLFSRVFLLAFEGKAIVDAENEALYAYIILGIAAVLVGGQIIHADDLVKL